MRSSRRARARALLHPLAHKGVAHWVRLAVLLALGFYGGHLLSEGSWLTGLRYSLYQTQLRVQRRGDVYPQRTALVLVNDDDYWAEPFARRSPLKRDQLALLLDRLREAGANTIVVDFDLRAPHPADPGFEFPDYQAEDAALLEAVGRLCAAGRHVVLSSSVRYNAQGQYEQLPSIYTTHRAAMPCLDVGYIELPDDMRVLPGPLALANGSHLDSLAMAAARVTDPIAYERVAENKSEGFRFTSFLTENDFRTRDGRQFIFSAHEIRGMDPELLHERLADRIVMVGARWHTRAWGNGPLADTFPSPGGPLPGAMLHANYIEAILDRTGTFTGISDTAAEVLEGLLVLVLSLIAALEVHYFWKWMAFVVGLTASILLTYVLLQSLGLFLDFAIPFLMIVVHTLVEEILCMREDLHKARHRLQNSIQELQS